MNYALQNFQNLYHASIKTAWSNLLGAKDLETRAKMAAILQGMEWGFDSVRSLLTEDGARAAVEEAAEEVCFLRFIAWRLIQEESRANVLPEEPTPPTGPVNRQIRD